MLLATSDDPAFARHGFFGPHGRAIRIPDRALRAERRRGLWDASDALVRTWLDEPRTATSSSA